MYSLRVLAVIGLVTLFISSTQGLNCDQGVEVTYDDNSSESGSGTSSGKNISMNATCPSGDTTCYSVPGTAMANDTEISFTIYTCGNSTPTCDALNTEYTDSFDAAIEALNENFISLTRTNVTCGNAVEITTTTAPTTSTGVTTTISVASTTSGTEHILLNITLLFASIFLSFKMWF